MIESKKERIIRFLDRKLSDRVVAQLVPCTVEHVRTIKYKVRSPEWKIRGMRKSDQHG